MKFKHVHYPIYFNRYFSIDACGNIIKARKSDCITKTFALFHYHTKSLEDFKIKQGRGRADMIEEFDYPNEMIENKEMNQVFDDTAKEMNKIIKNGRF